MKNIIVSLSAIIALALPTFASATTWTIDPDHSDVGFKVKHLYGTDGCLDRKTMKLSLVQPS